MVSLSTNESDPDANSAGTPNLNAARIPSFTHVCTFQTPSASRTAARMEPFSSSARKRPIALTASVRSEEVFSVWMRSSMVGITTVYLPIFGVRRLAAVSYFEILRSAQDDTSTPWRCHPEPRRRRRISSYKQCNRKRCPGHSTPYDSRHRFERQPAVAQDALERLPIGVADRGERRTDGVGRNDAEHFHRRLHGDRIRFDEVASHQRQDAIVHGAGAFEVAAERSRSHIAHQTRDFVCRDGDDS